MQLARPESTSHHSLWMHPSSQFLCFTSFGPKSKNEEKRNSGTSRIRRMEVEKQEGTRGWHKLPVEIQDFILHKVVELASEQVSCLMDLVLPFVCSTWRERRTFWKNKHVTGQMEKNTVCNAAATLGSIPLMEWLISLGYSMTTQH